MLIEFVIVGEEGKWRLFPRRRLSRIHISFGTLQRKILWLADQREPRVDNGRLPGSRYTTSSVYLQYGTISHTGNSDNFRVVCSQQS